MIRRTLIFLPIVCCLFGQAPFPVFQAEALSGRKVAMPAEVQGHPALLVIGFTHASGPHCTEWAKRLEAEFRTDTALERYSVIFLEDAPRLVRGMAKSGIKGGVPKDQYEHYLIVTEHEKDVKAAVRFSTPDDAYLVLLGPDGNIRWTFHSAAVSEDAIEQIRKQIR